MGSYDPDGGAPYLSPYLGRRGPVPTESGPVCCWPQRCLWPVASPYPGGGPRPGPGEPSNGPEAEGL